MDKLDVRVGVGSSMPSGEALEVAATVVLPEAGVAPKPVAMFAFPGGGYNRRYYDLQVAEGPDYSQAEFHARQGFTFVAVDHLGVGDSTVPTQSLDFDDVARANTAAAASIFDQLRSGTLGPGIQPIPLTHKVGFGQSFGGFVLTIGQGQDGWFDGVAMLGWSGIETQPPWPKDVSPQQMQSGHAGNGLDHPMRRTFHLDDVPESIVLADMTKVSGGLSSGAPWSTSFSPGGPALRSERGPLGPGVVSVEAAAITTPVLVAAGEVDVIADIRAEPAAYTNSADITVCAFPRMAHMHNFASTRHALWSRLAVWADGIPASLA